MTIGVSLGMRRGNKRREAHLTEVHLMVLPSVGDQVALSSGCVTSIASSGQHMVANTKLE